MQYDQESMYEAWERYKDLLRKCPHHELPGWLQIQTFYNGFRLEHRAMIDATPGGSLMRRTPEDAYGLLDDIALNSFSWNTDRTARKPSGIHSISTQAALAAQVEALQRQLNQMNAPQQQQLLSCEFCGSDHDSVDYPVNTSSEQANFMGNFQGGQNNFQRPMQN